MREAYRDKSPLSCISGGYVGMRPYENRSQESKHKARSLNAGSADARSLRDSENRRSSTHKVL